MQDKFDGITIGDTQDLLFEAQNVSGQVRDMSLVIVWYEE